MGRDPWSNRKTVEECKSLDIFWLKRHGYLCGFAGGIISWKNAFGEVTSSISIQVFVDNSDPGGNYIRMFYTQTDGFTGEKTELDYKNPLVTTPCNFGGVRYWFICSLFFLPGLLLCSSMQKWFFRAFRENGSLKITTDSEKTTWKLLVTHDIPCSTGSQFSIGQT